MRLQARILGISLASWALAIPAQAAVEAPLSTPRLGIYEVPLRSLSAAFTRGDRAEIARLAARIGPSRLGAALGDPDREVVRAALEATSMLDGGVLLLDDVARLGAGVPVIPPANPDAAPRPPALLPELAPRALSILGRLLGQAADGVLAEFDVPADVVIRACRVLARRATPATSDVGVRTAAIEALAEAASVCAPNPALLAEWGADLDPAIRRAGLLLIGIGGRRVDIPASAFADVVPQVAGAAAAASCASSREKKQQPGRSLSPALRAAIVADVVPAEDVIDLLPCLSRESGPQVAGLMMNLADRPGPVGDLARRLLKPGAR